MPGPSSKPTLAQAASTSNLSRATNTVAVEVVGDAIGRCMGDPSLGWSAALTASVAAAGVVNPVTVGAVFVLATALGVRRVLQSREHARALQATLKAEHHNDARVLDILQRLDDGSLQVGLDPFALEDIRQIVHAAVGQTPKLSEDFQRAFAATWTDEIDRLVQEGQDQGDLTRDHIDRRADRSDANQSEMLQLLQRIEREQKAQKQQNPDAPPTLSAEDQAVLDRAKASSDERLRLNASVLDPDDQTDQLLAAARARVARESFELDLLEGKRWYFARPVNDPDRAAACFDRAVAARPDHTEAKQYAIRAHTEARLGDIAEHRRAAIDLARALLPQLDPASADWATTQNNLGIAYCQLPTGDRGESLGRAIAAYEAAFQVRTRDAHPVDWAATQNNLGNAYSKLPTGDRGEHLGRAIAAYQAALQVRTRDAHPVQWAMTQNNLGVAYSDLPTGDRGENLGRAIAAYQAALQVRTRDAHPVDWAATQN
ncbi:MAG: hypothetical protein AAGG38_13600, partial [Planctomycetota bacterium]